MNEIEVADNRSILMEKSSNKFDGYCTLCITIRQLALNIRFKFTVMVLTLMFFQIALEAVYWRQEKDFITNETKVPVSVELGVIYSLFAFEFLILTSIIYARHVQGRSTSKGSEAIKESERKSNAEILKRRT